MTTVPDARDTRGGEVDATLSADLADLRRALADQPFPARQDDLIAACLGRHEPTRLACRLSKIPRERLYPDLEAVLADVEAAARGAVVPGDAQ